MRYGGRMKFIRNIVGLGTLFLCIGAIIWIDQQVTYAKHPSVREFTKRLHYAKNTKKRVTLSDLTPFSWEKVCFVYPYTSAQEIKKMLGDEYTVEPIDNAADRVFTMVFASPDRQAIPIRVSRGFFQANQVPGCPASEELEAVLLEVNY